MLRLYAVLILLCVFLIFNSTSFALEIQCKYAPEYIDDVIICDFYVQNPKSFENKKFGSLINYIENTNESIQYYEAYNKIRKKIILPVFLYNGILQKSYHIFNPNGMIVKNYDEKEIEKNHGIVNSNGKIEIKWIFKRDPDKTLKYFCFYDAQDGRIVAWRINKENGTSNKLTHSELNEIKQCLTN